MTLILHFVCCVTLLKIVKTMKNNYTLFSRVGVNYISNYFKEQAKFFVFILVNHGLKIYFKA